MDYPHDIAQEFVAYSPIIALFPPVEDGPLDRPGCLPFVCFAGKLCQSIAGVQSSRYVLILPPRAAVPPRPDPAVTTAKTQKKKNTEDEG